MSPLENRLSLSVSQKLTWHPSEPAVVWLPFQQGQDVPEGEPPVLRLINHICGASVPHKHLKRQT